MTPSIYRMDRPDLTVSNLMDNYIGTKRVVVLIVLPFCFLLLFYSLKISKFALVKN